MSPKSFECQLPHLSKEYDDSNKESGEKADSVKENVNKRCQLILKPNGGECDYSSYMYTRGSKIGTLPRPSRSEYTFIGWYTDVSEGKAIDSDDVINEDMTVYAQWTK